MATSKNTKTKTKTKTATTTKTVSQKKKKSATSPEEIARQHAQAQQIVNAGLFYSDIATAPIHRHHKQRPLTKDDTDSIPVWRSHGHIAVNAFVPLLQPGYRSGQQGYWSNDHKQNIVWQRPSHDSWGIHKIVLLYADDFLKKIYETPYYQLFADSLQPLYKILQIEPSQVVRLLFASLPPRTTIPIHSDSGEWVKHTHRIHVPMLVHNPNAILFRCGTSLETLQTIHCRPGHVFEINNQALHTVSNCDSDYRVHLILDYYHCDKTTTTIPPRIVLQPREVLYQTRRSIDRHADMGKRPTPSFIILGAQKAGTTYVYECLIQHPLIIPARRRETHNLDWRWNASLQTGAEQRQWCQTFFFHGELQQHPSCLTGDSTPSYLLDSRRVIPRLRAVYPWPVKFFCSCRNPVARALSHYQMVTSPIGTPAQLKTRGTEWRSLAFEQVIGMELQQLSDCGLLPYWTIAVDNKKNQTELCNCVFSPETFAAFAGSAQEDEAWNEYLQRHVPLHTGSYGLLARGMYELQLRPWLRHFDETDFLIFKLEAFSVSDLDRAWKHLDLPVCDIPDTSPKNTRDYDATMKRDTRLFLQRFYAPYNQRLGELLKGQEHWDETWSYDD